MFLALCPRMEPQDPASPVAVVDDHRVKPLGAKFLHARAARWEGGHGGGGLQKQSGTVSHLSKHLHRSVARPLVSAIGLSRSVMNLRAFRFAVTTSRTHTRTHAHTHARTHARTHTHTHTRIVSISSPHHPPLTPSPPPLLQLNTPQRLER